MICTCQTFGCNQQDFRKTEYWHIIITVVTANQSIFIKPRPVACIVQSISLSFSIGILLKEELFLMSSNIIRGIAVKQHITGKVCIIQHVSSRMEHSPLESICSDRTASIRVTYTIIGVIVFFSINDFSRFFRCLNHIIRRVQIISRSIRMNKFVRTIINHFQCHLCSFSIIVCPPV